MITRAKAEDWLPTLDAGSVQMLLLDPPYFKVAAEGWDHRWKNPADYLAWLSGLADEWRRVLADSGSIYVFASPAMAARVEVEVIAPRFEVLNSITWFKGCVGREGQSEKEALRGYFPVSERVIFAENLGADSMALDESGYASQCETLRSSVFEPLRAYLEGERKDSGVTRDQINEACGFAKGGMAGHYFSRSQWQLPRPEHYAKMQTLFNGHLRREYGHLRREYDDLRREYDDLRRPFQVSADVPHTDVWTYPTVERGPGRHSCEKPIEMIRDIIRASSRPGDIVADCFAGSGTTFAACVDTGREFVGCEEDLEWVRRGNDRGERHLSIMERRPVNGKRPAGRVTGPLMDLLEATG